MQINYTSYILKQRPKYTGKCKMVVDKIKVDTKSVRRGTPKYLSQLPESLNLEKFACRENMQIVEFFGLNFTVMLFSS